MIVKVRDYINDFKFIGVIFINIIKSPDFLISKGLVVILLLTSMLSPYSYINKLLIFFSIVISLIIFYDFFISYLLFNLRVFNKSDSVSKLISEKINNYIFSNVSENIFNSFLKDEIEDILDKKIKKIISNEKIRKLLIKINIFFIDSVRWLTRSILSFVLVEKNYNNFIHKMVRLYVFCAKKIYNLIIKIILLLFQVLIWMVLGAFIGLILVIILYFLMRNFGFNYSAGFLGFLMGVELFIKQNPLIEDIISIIIVIFSVFSVYKLLIYILSEFKEILFLIKFLFFLFILMVFYIVLVEPIANNFIVVLNYAIDSIISIFKSIGVSNNLSSDFSIDLILISLVFVFFYNEVIWNNINNY